MIYYYLPKSTVIHIKNMLVDSMHRSFAITEIRFIDIIKPSHKAISVFNFRVKFIFFALHY